MGKTGRGFNQRLAQKEEEEQGQQGQPAQSQLASELLSLWAWGHMSAPVVQQLAHAAFADGLQHPQIENLAKIGSRGKYPGNMQRDMALITGDFAKALQGCSTRIPIRLKKLGKNVTEEVPIDFLLPHKLFAAMYQEFPTAFEASLCGGQSGNIAKFWDQMRHHPFVLARPELQARPDLHKTIPLALHGDGVSYMQSGRAGGKSLEVLSWSSLLTQGPTKVTNFLMFALVKNVVKNYGFLNLTWPKVWRILCWSLQTLASGLWPNKDWDDHEFDEESEDYAKRGTLLAGGFCGVLFVLRSDLDFLANHFHLNHSSSNRPCALCQADREMQSRPWTDCRETARWRETIWSAADWAAANPTCHPLLRMPGAGLDLVCPDLMHLKHLGTDQFLLGSALTWIIKHYLKGTIAENLSAVWEFVQSWYKDSTLMHKPPGCRYTQTN